MASVGNVTADATDALDGMTVTVYVRNTWRLRLGAWLLGLAVWMIGASRVEIADPETDPED